MDQALNLKGTYVVYSDIQGSFDYVDRFFKATQHMRKNGMLCLGDIVHRFADFSDNRCIEAVKKNTDYCVRGNHENKISKKSQQKITPENLEYVSHLPCVKDLGNVVLFHSSVRSEGIRLRSKRQIQEEGEYIRNKYPLARFALFGHTHRKGAHVIRKDGVHSLEGDEMQVNPEELTLVNPGGIGLWYGLEKTFARINFSSGRLNFFTLEQAEEMSYKADIVNAFDARWMPGLNVDSYPWFLQYVKNDAPFLREKGKEDKRVGQLAARLTSFDRPLFEKVGSPRKKEYLERYSLELAGDVQQVRNEVREFYNTEDPFESRKEYLDLKRKKY